MVQASVLENLLGRNRTIVVSALVLLCGLSWAYILEGAGLGMNAWDMTRLAVFPHRQDVAVPEMARMAMPLQTRWSVVSWVLMIAMWWTMMVAMMTPSATPAILLYSRVQRHAAQDRSRLGLAPTGAFAAGYLVIWLAFSVAAAAVHWMLVRSEVISATMMDSKSRWLSAGVLILAGIYQQSRLKNACLSHCRTPASFLSRNWRPGARGALRLGVLHGAYCVGCCWALMALLFVGGVMNIFWIVALTLMVLTEKLLPGGRWVGNATGLLLIAWGLATLCV